MSAQIAGVIVQAAREELPPQTLNGLWDKHHLQEAAPFYAQDAWLHALQDIRHYPDAHTTLIAIGRGIARRMPFYETIPSIGALVPQIDALYHGMMQHIPPNEGFRVASLGERRVVIYHATPHPPEWAYGFLWGLLARCQAPTERFTLTRLLEDAHAFELRWE